MEDIRIGDIILSWVYDRYEGLIDGVTVFVERSRKKDPWKVTLHVNQKKYEERARNLHPDCLRAAILRVRAQLREERLLVESAEATLTTLEKPVQQKSIWERI